MQRWCWGACPLWGVGKYVVDKPPNTLTPLDCLHTLSANRVQKYDVHEHLTHHNIKMYRDSGTGTTPRDRVPDLPQGGQVHDACTAHWFWWWGLRTPSLKQPSRKTESLER